MTIPNAPRILHRMPRSRSQKAMEMDRRVQEAMNEQKVGVH